MKKVGAVIIGGDFQGLGILRSLASRDIPVYLLDHDLCISRFSRFKKMFVRCPEVTEELAFLNFLTDLAEKESLKGWVVYPNNDDTVCFLAKYKERLEECYRIPTQSWDIVRLALDKKLTYQLAENSGIPVPKTFYPQSISELEHLSLQYPVVIKPSVKEPFYSITKKKAIRVDNSISLKEEFEKAVSIAGPAEVMVQELIPGGPANLFSVGSLCENGELLGRVVVQRRRQHPMDFGHATTYAYTLDVPELEEVAKRILGLIGYYGLSEVEFMRDPRDGKFKLLEINARPWGWHTLAIAAGVDLPYMLYLNMLGESVRQNGFEKGVKWIRLTTDVPTSIGAIIKRDLKVTDYISSLRGRKQFAVLSLQDPLPFIMEFLMIPYLWKRRGF
jgi:predicted ATP-grasp superfamily ATP-dependent carboligase